MKKTLKSTMIFWIWGTTVIIFSIVLYINFHYTEIMILNKLKENAKNLAKYHAKQIDEQFSKAAVIPVMNAIGLEQFFNQKDGKVLEEYLKKVLENNPYIFGSCIAWEPYEFDKKKKYYAPYYHFSDSKGGKPVCDILGNDEYNYFTQDWYSIPAKGAEPVWIEPYLDTGVNIFMVTYAVPFKENGIVRGVTTADISLLKLTEEINNIKLLKTGYAFIVSYKGIFIAFPNERQVKELENIDKFNKDLGNKMTEQMKLAKKGKSDDELGDLYSTFDPYYKENAWIYLYPIRNGEFCIAFVYPEKEVKREVYELEQNTALAGTVGLALLLIVIIILSNSITEPVTKLVNLVKKVAKGDLDNKITVDQSIYEVKTLATDFNNMMDDLKKYIAENQKITSEKERILNELSVANKIQMSVIPQTFPAFPDRKEIDIYAKILPALEVGGDFYDFSFIDENHLGFAIGDASGKGIPAALFVAVTRAFLKATALRVYEPGECFKHVNDLLCGEDYQSMFITMFYGTLNTNTGELHYCNGGHNPPYLIKKDGTVIPLTTVNGPALGAIDGVAYSTVKIDIEDGIFLYTDGVTEAFNKDGQEFSSERLCEVLKDMKNFTPEDAVKEVFQQVKDFAKDAPQSDDITVMAVKFLGK